MAVTAILPGGSWANGVAVRQAELRALSIEDEIALSDLAEGLPLAAYASHVLARSLVRVGERAADIGLVRELSAGDREALLLHVWRLMFGERLACVLSCPSLECGRPMDLDLRVGDLLLGPYVDWQPRYRIDRGGWQASFRVPNGGDLEAAAYLASTDAHAAARALVRRILDYAPVAASDPTCTPVEIDGALAGRLAEIDPQAELRINLHCAECGFPFSIVLNAAAHLREELAHRMRRIYEEVHTLASAYHWSEAEILRMPPSRRQMYLHLVERRTS